MAIPINQSREIAGFTEHFAHRGLCVPEGDAQEPYLTFVVSIEPIEFGKLLPAACSARPPEDENRRPSRETREAYALPAKSRAGKFRSCRALRLGL